MIKIAGTLCVPAIRKKKDMQFVKGKVTKLLVDFFEVDFRRISHALDVLKHAEAIAEKEQPEDLDADVLIAAALLHDVGIKPSEEALGYNDAKTQEKYGPPVAEKLLTKMDFPKHKIIKICEIVGNHHSPSRYDYTDLRILEAADRILNHQEREEQNAEKSSGI